MNSDDGKHDPKPVGTMEPVAPPPAPAPAPSPEKSQPARPARAASPSRKPVAPRRQSLPELEEDDAPKGFKKFQVPIILGVLALGGIIAARQMLSSAANAPQAKPEVTQVVISAPPPVAPPPPPPPPPQEAPKEAEKMITEDTPKEEDNSPPVQIQTANGPGKGPGIAGLGRGNGTGLATNRAGANAEKMRISAYGLAAKNAIIARLKADPKTRKMVFADIVIRSWYDSTGRVNRATFQGTSGDPALDAYARDEVVVGTQLSDGPPEGMPNPIVMRFHGTRPTK